MPASNDGAPDPSLVSRSERVFASFLAETREPTEAEIERLADEHRDLAGELRELYRDWLDWRVFRSTPGMLVSRARVASSSTNEDCSEGGERIAHFQCLRLIGRGGMGEVWEAIDLDLKRRVALKLLPLGTDAGSLELARFRREAEAAGNIRHDGIVAVYSAGASGGRAYIAYELVPGGRTLRHWLDELARASELPSDHDLRVARWFVELCAALEAAHSSGVIHRDLKPQNVLLTPEGRPKIADFGLAKIEGADALSHSGSFVGTWPYASPEQVASDGRPLDARSDVFSLGVTLYECLTLRRPFTGDTSQQIAHQILEFDPPDPRAVRSRCSRELAVICAKAIEKSRERRYSSSREFGDDLRRFLAHEPIAAREPSSLERAVKWTRRHPTSSTAISLSSIVFLTLMVLFLNVDRARRDALSANVALRAARGEALANARHALEEAALARDESAISEQVTSFLIDMFDDANPNNGAGEQVTASQVLDRALLRIRSDRSMDLRTRARLEVRLATVFAALGRPEDTRELLFEACDVYGGPDGERSNDAEDARSALGAELGRSGFPEASFELLDAVAARALASAETECARVSSDLIHRAEVLARLGRFAEGEAVYLRALEFADQDPDRDDAEVADSFAALAKIYRQEHRPDDAERAIRRSIELYTRSLGASNARTVGAQSLLGVLRQSQGRLAEAEAIFEDCLPKLEQALGAEHISVLTVRGNLAIVLAQTGKLDRAAELLRGAIAIRKPKASADDRVLVNLEAQLAACLIGQGKFDEAEPLADAAMAARSKAFGASHPQTLEAANLLAEALFELKRYPEALELARRTVELMDPNAPELVDRRQLLSDIQSAIASHEKN